MIPPFLKEDELIEDNVKDYRLFQENKQSSAASKDVDHFLRQELSTPLLNELHDHLWLVAKKAHDHIDPIHDHIIKNRVIIAAENPKLHLVWYYKTVFVKPIPICFLNHRFWKGYFAQLDLNSTQSNKEIASVDLSEACRLALGFLRSYSYLIQHESDFNLAKEAHLIPKTMEYASFDRFIRLFRHLDDTMVAKRYHFGQFRLTRLNFAVRILRPSSTGKTFPWYYHQPYWQTGQFFQDLAGPLLFVFAAFSLILSAMQVVIAAVGTTDWPAFTRVSWGFSVATIILIAVVAVAAAAGVSVWWLRQFLFSVSQKKKGIATKKDNPS